ncbi:hypothetical protein MLD38_000725 [Melastoma candidum]|uniref:Uncharacterized protein n=1 Tax=Melastoma candidum TaxID=119954 RepID=A0ACB9SAX7_9MYRT|nr:hypothetical protein MLD38_000725 [Melastoma candidum]
MGYGRFLAREWHPTRCTSASMQPGQVGMLLVGLYLIALGTSGVKAALLSLGTNQFDIKDPKEANQWSSFFNWFLFSLTVGAVIRVTFLVYISTYQGWHWSFGVCTIAVTSPVVFISMGKSLYRINKPKGIPIVRIFQVVVASVRNHDLPFPSMNDQLHGIYDKEAGKHEEILDRTNQFRFLDRAAIMRGTGNGSPSESSGP